MPQVFYAFDPSYLDSYGGGVIYTYDKDGAVIILDIFNLTEHTMPTPTHLQADRWYHVDALPSETDSLAKPWATDPLYADMIFDLIVKNWDKDTDTFKYDRRTNYARRIAEEKDPARPGHTHRVYKFLRHEHAITERVVAFYIHPNWDAIQTAAQYDSREEHRVRPDSMPDLADPKVKAVILGQLDKLELEIDKH